MAPAVWDTVGEAFDVHICTRGISDMWGQSNQRKHDPCMTESATNWHWMFTKYMKALVFVRHFSPRLRSVTEREMHFNIYYHLIYNILSALHLWSFFSGIQLKHYNKNYWQHMYYGEQWVSKAMKQNVKSSPTKGSHARHWTYSEVSLDQRGTGINERGKYNNFTFFHARSGQVFWRAWTWFQSFALTFADSRPWALVMIRDTLKENIFLKCKVPSPGMFCMWRCNTFK